MANKKPENFRLSEENIKFITEFSKRFGMNKTELIEFMITLIRNQPKLFIKSFETQFVEVINRLSV
jgi:hypothetical protein